jgi:hypothetical protein
MTWLASRRDMVTGFPQGSLRDGLGLGSGAGTGPINGGAEARADGDGAGDLVDSGDGDLVGHRASALL